MSALTSASLFDHALSSFHDAARSAGGVRECVFAAAGYRVRVLLAGPALEAPLTASLAHLRADRPGATDQPRGPSLTVHAWDSASTGMPYSVLPWTGKAAGSPRELPYFERDGLRVLFNPNSGVLSLLNAPTDEAVCWVAAAGDVPSYERAAPFRTILQWWMADHGRLLVHSAAVGRNGRGLLIAGRGGAGKSTTAWLCLRRGLELAGDDYVILAQEAPDRVYGLYSSLKLGPEPLTGVRDQVPRAGGVGREPAEKSVTYLMPAYEEYLARCLSLQAILLPRITRGGATSIRAASAADAMRALAPSTVYHQAGARAATFRTLAALVRRVPCHVLELGADTAAVPEVIARFLKAC